MKTAGQKKFLLQTTSGTHFGILSIIVDPVDLNKRGTLTFMYIDKHGFAKPWEREWLGMPEFSGIQINMAHEARNICRDNGAELYNY